MVMNFKFKRDANRRTSILIDGLTVGKIIPSQDSSYYKIFLAVADSEAGKWSVLKTTFSQDSGARSFLTTRIDEILERFPLYPITS